MINLLSNAVKFNKRGGKVSVSGSETKKGLFRISVEDTGIGIPADIAENVFQMFERVIADPMQSSAGTGIGLAVTKLLVEQMGGRIGYESEVDVGSTFWIELPVSKPD